MPSMTDVVAGASALASDVQQLIDAWKGTVGKGIPASLTAANDAINYALAVKNNDAGASKAFIVYKADGTVLLQVDKNGVIASPDGTLGASQIATLAGTQTFTNKTLTSPHFTAPVVDSGGLTVTAGNVGIGGASSANQFLTMTGTLTGAGAQANGLQVSGTIQAGANNDLLQGIYVSSTFSANAKTGVQGIGLNLGPMTLTGSTSMTGLSVGGISGANTTNIGIRVTPITGAATNAYGVLVDSVTAAGTNNFGVYISPPSGASGQVFSLFCASGTADINLGGTTVLGTTAVVGFPYLPSCAGAPTGVPTNATVGRPIVMDSTNNKLWCYINGAWKGVVLS